MHNVFVLKIVIVKILEFVNKMLVLISVFDNELRGEVEMIASEYFIIGCKKKTNKMPWRNRNDSFRIFHHGL